jgi:GMP synthase (glutamine-hydrolysing)
MKVLIIDNNIDRDSWGAQPLVRLVQESSRGTGIEINVRRAPQSDLPSSPRNFDRIIVSGSKTSCLEQGGWIDLLDRFILRTLEEGVPYLGVCYGHQSLIRALNGVSALRRTGVPEFGWTQLEIVEKSSLFDGVPERFVSFSSHFEEAHELPRAMRRLVRSVDCEIQACDFPGKPVFGIQFHPEKTIQEGESLLDRRKALGTPSQLLGHGQGSRLYQKEVGNQIFSNFLAGKYLLS